MLQLSSDLNPKFIQLFRETFGLDAQEFEYLLSFFYEKTIPKKKYYLRAGEHCTAKAYLNSGCMRNFVVDEKGHERILFFPFEDWWVGDFESYYTDTPGTNYIQALEDCTLLLINKIDFSNLEKEIPKLQQWYIRKMMPAVSASRKRLEDVKTLSPEDRYLALVEKQPFIFQRVPLKYIAAFLNIEPPSLSRMRKRLSGK